MSGRSSAGLLLPPAVVLAAAVVFSVGLHVPAYVGLGMLKVLLEEAPAPAAPMEVEIVDSRPVPPTADEPADDPAPIDERDDEEPERPRLARAEPEPEPEPQRAEPEPEPEPVEADQVEMPQLRPPPPPPEERELVRVEQHAQNPDEPPPEDAQHAAEQNNRVEEETLARIRNPNMNDPEPQAATPTEALPPAEDEGDSAEEEVAELQEVEGSDERDPTREEIRTPPPPRPTRAPSRSRTPAVAEAARGDGRRGASEGDGRPQEAAGGGRTARGGGESVPTREVVVSDGLGTWRMRVPDPDAVAGEGEGEGGGPAVAGRGTGTEGEGSGAGRAGRSRRRARGGSAGGRGAPNLRMSWTQFASVYGEEELERERELRLEQRRSESRGAARQRHWQQFRAAMEHHDVRVRPGNQTALNARMDPFATYIARMHNARIHPRFAGDYLHHVPPSVAQTFQANPNMHTKLEIGIDAEGRVAHISVIGTSGDLMFDLGAFEAIMRSQPFEATPANIRSPDGLVYLHWSFYRNQRQCGTFNARGFILSTAPDRDRGDDADPVMDRGTVFGGREPEPAPPEDSAGDDDTAAPPPEAIDGPE